MEDITVLKQALPYIRRFKGSTFVIKFGGEAMTDRGVLERLVEDVTLLHLVGIRVVVVHGGGKHVTALAAQLGIESTFVGGRRVTDEKLLDVVTMVLSGKISVEKKDLPCKAPTGPMVSRSTRSFSGASSDLNVNTLAQGCTIGPKRALLTVTAEPPNPTIVIDAAWKRTTVKGDAHRGLTGCAADQSRVAVPRIFTQS